MSKKVTGKDLEKLLEGVLSERTKRLILRARRKTISR